MHAPLRGFGAVSGVIIETMDGPARTRAFRDLVEIVYGTREPEREKMGIIYLTP